MTGQLTTEDLDPNIHEKDLNGICRMCGWDCPLDEAPTHYVERCGGLTVYQPIRPKPRKTP